MHILFIANASTFGASKSIAIGSLCVLSPGNSIRSHFALEGLFNMQSFWAMVVSEAAVTISPFWLGSFCHRVKHFQFTHYHKYNLYVLLIRNHHHKNTILHPILANQLSQIRYPDLQGPLQFILLQILTPIHDGFLGNNN